MNNDDKLYFNDPNCTYNSKFNLLGPTEKGVRRVDDKIEMALRKCVKRINEIERIHPGYGIGDTATDEAIADVFYNILHWGH